MMSITSKAALGALARNTSSSGDASGHGGMNQHDKRRQPLANLSPNKSNSTSAAGAKRSIDSADDNDEDGISVNSDDFDGYTIDKNADQVRRMISNYIDSGEMKVTEFHNKLNLTSRSYYAFMRQHGPDKGTGSDTFMKAWAFFKKREERGKPAPKKQRKTRKTGGGSSGSGVKIPGSESAGGHDLSNIHLEGEERDAVPVYDTCDEVRKKIGAHLRKDGVVQAAFLRDVKAQYHSEKAPNQIQGTQLTRFRSQKGPQTGATGSVFYGAYCFFEKLRIAEGKKKSAHREEMEKTYGPAGFDITTNANRRVWCSSNQQPVMDQYGRVSIV